MEDSCVVLQSKGNDSWITFLSHRSGKNVLYKMRPDGDELAPIFGGALAESPGLADDRVLYREPHWSRLSPDRAYFLSWATDRLIPSEPCEARTTFMIHLGRTDSSPTRVLAYDCYTSEVFCWAPDSRTVAYSRFAGPDSRTVTGLGPRVPSTQVVVAGIDGSRGEVVLEKPGFWHACDWSPDGRKLLLLYWPTNSPVYGRSDLIEFDIIIAREQEAKFKDLGVVHDHASSRSIEFSSLKSLTDAQPISTFLESARYSPSGEQIAMTFTRRMRSIELLHHELGVWDVASETLRPIAKYTEGLRGPICWSPDGTQIAFSRPLASDDQRENLADPDSRGLGIWTIRPDGSGERFLTTGWSPDWH
jgi:Tol biopolymer transport system component